MKLHELSAVELSEKIKNSDITSEEVTKVFLDRINSIDEKTGAFVSVNGEKALKEAKEYGKRENRSPLHGVPIAIKDNILSIGDLTTSASKILDNYIGIYDSTVVKKIKENCMPILGKTNMDEFAMGSSNENSGIKPVSNVWDTDRVPGGSSGGSATAVAAGEAPVALGTDTGGSVRQPAALSGVVGVKPTYGRVSRYGLMAFGSSLDQIGVFSKTVRDAAETLKIIAGYDEMDSTSADIPVDNYTEYLTEDIKGLKIGIPKEYFSESLDSEIKKVIDNSINMLKEQGAEIREISLPHTKYAVPTYYIIACAEAASNLARYDGVRYGYRGDNSSVEDMYVKSRTQGLGKEVKRRIMLGNYVLSSGFYDAYYKKASQVRRLIKNDFDKALEEVDVILTPTSPVLPFKKGEKMEDPVQMYLADIYTVSINLAGLPGISVPAGFVDGLPVGLQIIGKFFDEATLFRVSDKFEKIRGKITYPEL